MTPRFSSIAINPIRLTRQHRLIALFASSLLVSFGTGLSGCGGQSSDPLGSTDTGNPPVIAETKLRVVASDDGVVVSGDEGAVTAGSQIKVTNLVSNKSDETTAAADGSFEVSVPGTVNDDYRVDAELNGKRSSTEVNAPSADADLNEHTFLLESAEGYEQVEGTSIQISFKDGELGFNAGCNGHFGAYTLCDGKLCVSDMGSTEIGCDLPLHEQDEWLADFFTSSPSYTYEPPRLTIKSDAVTFEFLDREQANPDRTLTARVWTIDTFFQGGTASNLPTQDSATIEFDTDGTFSAFDTCNTLNGLFVVDGQELTVSEVSTTDIYCEASLAVQDHIGGVLNDGTLSFEIDAARLTLMRGELGLGATTE